MCTVFCVLCTMYCVQFKVYSVQCHQYKEWSTNAATRFQVKKERFENIVCENIVCENIVCENIVCENIVCDNIYQLEVWAERWAHCRKS